MQRTVHRFALPFVSAAALALVALVCVSCDLDLRGLSIEGPARPLPKRPPVISSVTWSHQLGCSPGDTLLVSIRTAVVDTDTDPGDLKFSGSVDGCSGTIGSATTTVTCPEEPGSSYSGTVTVTDPDGNSDSMRFSFGPCEDGEVPQTVDSTEVRTLPAIATPLE